MVPVLLHANVFVSLYARLRVCSTILCGYIDMGECVFFIVYVCVCLQACVCLFLCMYVFCMSGCVGIISTVFLDWLQQSFGSGVILLVVVML